MATLPSPQRKDGRSTLWGFGVKDPLDSRTADTAEHGGVRAILKTERIGYVYTLNGKDMCYLLPLNFWNFSAKPLLLLQVDNRRISLLRKCPPQEKRPKDTDTMEIAKSPYPTTLYWGPLVIKPPPSTGSSQGVSGALLVDTYGEPKSTRRCTKISNWKSHQSKQEIKELQII